MAEAPQGTNALVVFEVPVLLAALHSAAITYVRARLGRGPSTPCT